MNKRATGLWLVGIGVVMIMYFIIEMRYFKIMDLISEKDYDMKIVSANDFTIHIKMTDSMNLKFLNRYRSKSWEAPYIQTYEDDLSKKIEKYIHALRPDLVYKDCEIADLQFGFDNAKLLNMLEARANALRVPDFEKA